MRRRAALVTLLLSAARPAAATEEAVRRGRRLHFPRDHGAHLGAAIEWWYLTGELHGSGRAHYGFQITFFRSRTGLAQALFPGRADGSLTRDGGRVIGSALIGQSFSDPRFFWSRPSATPAAPYDAASSAGSER